MHDIIQARILGEALGARAPRVSNGAPKKKREKEGGKEGEKLRQLPRGRGEGEMAKLEAMAPTRKAVKMAPLPCGALRTLTRSIINKNPYVKTNLIFTMFIDFFEPST